RLPVIVHARRAVDEVTAAIRRIGGLRGVVHSFSGSRQQAQALWDLGFLIGLGGPVTWPRAQRLRRLAATMPLECLLLETDAPDQPGCDRRGERNEPGHLRDRKSTRLNSSHVKISYAVFCLKKKKMRRQLYHDLVDLN